MRAISAILTVAALASVAASCASGSNRLPSRIVDDPIVLPGGMGSVAIGAYRSWEPASGDSNGDLSPLDLHIGLGDRVELDDLFSLRVALLDDSPGRPTPPLPISLAVRAGSLGLGFSSTEGYILLPVLEVAAQKHVAGRWRVAAAAAWSALWVQKPVDLIPDYNGGLAPIGRRRSTLELGLGVTRQLTQRFAAHLGGSVWQSQNCVEPFCAWTTRGAGTSLSLLFRPLRWLTLRVSSGASYAFRPRILNPTQNPVVPIDTPPTSASWVNVSGAAILYW